jgi:hypothetical protein
MNGTVSFLRAVSFRKRNFLKDSGEKVNTKIIHSGSTRLRRWIARECESLRIVNSASEFALAILDVICDLFFSGWRSRISRSAGWRTREDRLTFMNPPCSAADEKKVAPLETRGGSLSSSARSLLD